MIPQTNWKWWGHAGHFICSPWCRFHMTTEVGNFLISTVGEYLPDTPVRETIAESRGIALVGKGDERLADYMRKIGFEDIGFGRKYETMVFAISAHCTDANCDCGGAPLTNLSEADTKGYNTAGAARSGHIAMCQKWSTSNGL